MSYRAKRVSALIIALGLIVAWTVAHAGMRGNTYYNDQHRISFDRPDGSWEVRENPAQDHAVALFSNGQGRVIALLSDRMIPPKDVITSPSDLRGRWPALADEIRAMASPRETEILMYDAVYNATDAIVTFDLHYTSRNKSMGGKVRNWVTGLMVRDSDNRQHIYSLRCAAPEETFESWESQFERIMPTLSYTGQKKAPFYTSAPIPWYWFALGALALIVVVALIRRSKQQPESYVPVRPRPESAPQMPASPAPAPEADDGTVPNVPDQMLVAADLTDPTSAATDDIPDLMYREAAADGQTYNESDAPQGFWKCECGRMNAADEEYCVRCNADRVRA